MPLSYCRPFRETGLALISLHRFGGRGTGRKDKNNRLRRLNNQSSTRISHTVSREVFPAVRNQSGWGEGIGGARATAENNRLTPCLRSPDKRTPIRWIQNGNASVSQDPSRISI